MEQTRNRLNASVEMSFSKLVLCKIFLLLFTVHEAFSSSLLFGIYILAESIEVYGIPSQYKAVLSLINDNYLLYLIDYLIQIFGSDLQFFTCLLGKSSQQHKINVC